MKKKRKKSNESKIIGIFITIIIAFLMGILGINQDELETTSSDANNTTNTNNVASQNTEFVAEDNLKVYFIDVGQADSILIVNKDQTMLIDAGGNEKGKEVVEFIQSKGITKLNYVIGTHPHEDHIGGLDDVINSFDIENILMPKIQTNTKTFEDVLDAINNKGLKITSPQKGNTFNIGDAKCEIMTDSISDESNLNLSSIIIRLEFGNKSFLFMGDAETKNENTITWDKVDVLKVGHHGSTTSSSKKFLNQVKPEIAIIMVGKDNSYNLPKDEIVTRLQNVGASIYRTDENGTILIETDGNNISVDKSK
jgi:competence protein ComEC